MCGIFGVIAKEENYNRKVLIKILEDIAKYSQVRGKDSSGLAYRFESTNTVKVLKGPFSIDNLLNSNEYKFLKKEIIDESKQNINEKIFAAFGHARLVTNGSQLEDENNQPVVKDGIVGVHNGIIANVESLWEKHNYLKRDFEIDTEFFFTYNNYLIYKKNGYDNLSNTQACITTNKEVVGTVSIAYYNTFNDSFILFSNFGSLYVLTDYKTILIFGSEKNILLRVIKKYKLFQDDKFNISQIKPISGYHINYQNFSINKFVENDQNEFEGKTASNIIFKVEIKNIKPIKKQLHAVIDPKIFSGGLHINTEKKLLEYNLDKITYLKRCSKCILPETFPFIEFNENGVCNYCVNYKLKNQPKPFYDLEKLVKPYRKKNGEVDCLIPYSGGRDSTFTLHFVKKVLGMNPIAFTYDWGMVTDLARRNIARVCGKLRVENVIVAADIQWKRKNINKNISAWLKNPELGMIPLFMAGDKFFYYYTNQVKKQNNLKLNIWGINPLENTDFKTGFAGVPPNFNKKRIFSLNINEQIKLYFYVTKNVINSLGYINQSVLDSIGSIFSRYINPKKDYFHLFDYYKWDENEIDDLIKNEYGWEMAVDTNTTWRIGDGTASFYNYIYYTVAGFSEYDTFRSNQIREGALTREKAIQIIKEENKPRYETMKWYLEIVGLEFQTVIRRINQIPKLY